MTADSLEVEVKFLVGDLAAVRQRLLAAEAVCTRPRVYERNVRFDDATESLRQGLKLLRLRQDTRTVLTFKGPAPAHLESTEAKVREELEVEVSDFNTAATIFERLGLRPLQVYEKYRETFGLNGVEVVLDELPYGNFVELEGDEEGLKQVAAILALNWDERLLTNYLALMEALKGHYGLSFDDVTFSNFAGLDISVAAVLKA